MADERKEAIRKGGHKDDSGKLRIDLFPGDALFAICDILTSGAIKYNERNWEKGMDWHRTFGALMRHMWAWWQCKGPTNESFLFGALDVETKRSHLWHAGCCIVFLIAYEMRGIGTDDRPRPFLAPMERTRCLDCGVELGAKHHPNCPREGVFSEGVQLPRDPMRNSIDDIEEMMADLRANKPQVQDAVYR